MPAVTSSVMTFVEHDAEKDELRITFTSGRIYVYPGVPCATYDSLLAAPSKGVFFNAEIRDVHVGWEVTGRRGRGRR